MKDKVTTKDRFQKWLSALSPLYGEREAKNMWRWYEEADRTDELFEKDLSLLTDHYPIQYLTGYSYFYGAKFHVNENTLIPRPETEELVYKILEDHSNEQKLKVIDLGAGTGCIAITLKKQRPGWEVTGLDLYEDTLKMAQKNSQFHQVEVAWIKGNILELSSPLTHLYDVVVSNPPYISPDEKPNLNKNVLDYEPHHALFTSDQDGLEFYKAIAEYGRTLTPGAEIYLEIHEKNSQLIAKLFEDSTFSPSTEIIKDMQGKDRILHVKRNN